MPVIEFWNTGTVAERQLVQLGKRIGNVIVLPINFAYPVHGPPSSFSNLARTSPTEKMKMITFRASS